MVFSCDWLITRLLDAQSWVKHTLVVEKEVESSLICLMDCETAYRAYLLTGEKQYLEPYETCYRHEMGHLETIQKLTKDNPNQQKRMPELFELAKRKIEFTQKVIQIREKSPNVSGQGLISIEPGKVIMDRFRAVNGDTIAEEERLLDSRVRSADQMKNAVYISLIVLSVLFLLTVGAIVQTTRTYVRERNERERILRDAQIKAKEADEAKTRFLAHMSHEVRTPLGGVLGLLEILKDSPHEDERQEIFAQIENSGQHLLFLMNEILDYAKLKSGTSLEPRYGEFSVASLLNSIKTSLGPFAASKGIDLQINNTIDSKEELSADSDRIKQVLLNMVQNAIKFTNKGGKVDVVASMAEANAETQTLRFEVKDSGIGISESDRNKLFIPFTQLSSGDTRKYEGAGLGLSICKSLVEMMKGKIDFESKEGAGSTFWFTVPVEVVKVTE
jgi:signal transduction histidine kinase